MTGKDELFGMSAEDFRNVAYRAILEECEHIERTETYKGNGHHLAQRLADMVSDEIVETVSHLKEDNSMNNKWPHEGEEWVHKDGSGSVTIDAMLKYDTFYTKRGDKWTCGTETFKKMYMEKSAWELSQTAHV